MWNLAEEDAGGSIETLSSSGAHGELHHPGNTNQHELDDAQVVQHGHDCTKVHNYLQTLAILVKTMLVYPQKC